MPKAFKRLLFITFTFLLSFALSLFLIRKIGEKKTPSSKIISDLNDKDLILLRENPENLIKNSNLLKERLENAKVILAIDLYYDENSQWKIFFQKKEHQTFPPQRKKQKTKPQSNMDLKDFLNSYPQNKPILLKLFTFDQKALNHLLEILHLRLKKDKSNTLIQSPFSKALKRLKKMSSKLLFVSHESSLLQLHLMSFLFIETFHKIKSDIFILSPTENLPMRALRELKRNQKKIFLTVNHIKEYKLHPLKDKFNGIHIKNSKEFLKNCSALKKLTLESLKRNCA